METHALTVAADAFLVFLRPFRVGDLVLLPAPSYAVTGLWSVPPSERRP